MISVPYHETVTIVVPEASRVLSVNPAIVEAALRPGGTVVLHAVAFGQTFVHIWSPSGRLTRAVQVVQPVIKQPTTVEQQRREATRAQHLTFEYQNRFRTLRRGPTIGDTDLNTTTQFDHDLTGHMEAPYGDLRGRVFFQRIDSANDLSSYYGALTDGRIGPFRRFDAIGGDTSVGFSDLSLPSGTIRGAQLRYYDLEPYVAEAFYGRRRLGFLQGLSPGTDVEEDLFLSGGRLQDVQRPWTWSVAYAGASGDDRADIQTSQALEGNAWYWPSEGAGVGVEAGRNQENAYGYRVKSVFRGSAFDLDTTYRNLSQRFENLLGISAEQGERGVLISSNWRPARSIRLRESADVYKDTLFVNPEEPDVLNLDVQLGADVDLTDSLLWSSRYGRQRLLGRLFPSDTTDVDTSVRQRIGQFPLLTNGSIFGGYQFRDLRSVNAPESDFHSHTLRVGLGAPLADIFYWQVSQQWTLLEQELSGDDTVPRETSAGVNYFQRFTRLPISLRGGVNYSIASNAEAPNSFLADEQRLTCDAGLQYDLSPDARAFVSSRFMRRQQPVTGREFEIELETGVRCFFDTGVAWQPSAKLSGMVFQDANGDGQRQVDESGLPKVTVKAGADRKAVTDPGGRFYLGTIRGKRTEVAVDLTTTPQGYVPTSPSSIEVDLTAPSRRPLTFGFVVQSELRVRVFVDANGNGHYDATDVPLEHIRLSLTDGQTVTTDRAGWAYVRAIRPGAYTVTLLVSDLAAGYVPLTASSQARTVEEGQAAVVDFPIRAERSIGGRVYLDQNRNAHYEDGEPLLPGVVVCLDGSARTKTQEDGRYVFKGVTAGLHRVRLNCGALLRGSLPLSATMQAVDVPPGSVQFATIDFRLGEAATIIQDVTADVLRERKTQQELVEEMIRVRKAQRALEEEMIRSRKGQPGPN